MNINKLIAGSFLLGSIVSANYAWAVQENQIAPPDVNVIDELGVNLATGQISANVETVSIGGSMGLSHTFSAYTTVPFTSNYGYIDKFAGSAKWTTIGKWVEGVGGFRYEGTSYSTFKAMRVFGPMGSQEFLAYYNGQLDPVGHRGIASYTYKALGDERHTLRYLSSGPYAGGLVWETPDGTATYYHTTAIKEIVYPNGLSWTITRFGGVKTNTGFALKYDYPTSNPGLSAEKAAIERSLPGGAQIPDILVGSDPFSITAVNTAEEYCSVDSSSPCSLSEDWPKAEFDWPGGMPQALYLGDSTIRVTDANGGKTEFFYEAHDLLLWNLNDPNSHVDDDTWGPRERWAPRLVGIKRAGSDATQTYTHKNSFKAMSSGEMLVHTYWNMASETGELTKASGPNGNAGYIIGQNPYPGGLDYRNVGRNLIVENIARDFPGRINWVDASKVGRYEYERNFRNFVLKEKPLVGPDKTYIYNDTYRGNLTAINLSTGESVSATYPSSCTSANRKICNKPTSTTDARGSTTNYTYDAPSGQVATVTLPADEDGVRPQTRYTYAQKYAYYKKNSNSVVAADTPVWMLVKEEYCMISQASGSNCAAGADDEVVTEYDYGPQDGRPNNLLLRGVKVTGLGDSGVRETRVTCYEYDIYGNRIGETLPKAGKTQCY